MGSGKYFPPLLISYGIFSWKVRIEIFSSRQKSVNPGLLHSSSGHRLGIQLTGNLPSSKWVSLCVSEKSSGKPSHLAFAATGSHSVDPNEGERFAFDRRHSFHTTISKCSLQHISGDFL